MNARRAFSRFTAPGLFVLLFSLTAGAQPARQVTDARGVESVLVDHTITATAGAGGGIAPGGAVLVADGADQAFTITPNVGYYVADVHVDTVSVGAVGSYTFFTVLADHSIEAFFGLQTFTVSASAGPNGSITPAGDSIVGYGNSVDYTITPDPGYFISDVLVDTVSVGSVGNYSFTTVTSDHTIEASFAPEYTLDISVVGGGTVMKNPDQASYHPGVNVQLTAAPADANWYFSHWECDTSGSANPLTISMNGNKTITAVFARVVGQFVPQGGKIVGTGSVGVASQGTSVAISADGSTAIVGGPADNGGTGAAWMYTRCNEVWSQQGGKLVGTGAAGAAAQGQSVSLSADGNTAVVGGFEDNTGVGAAWIFVRTSGVWTQQGPKLTGTGAVGTSRQGYAVAVSGDGNTVILGGFLDDGGIGAVWVFTRSGSTWSQQGSKLVGTGAVNLGGQGRSVSLSSDGNTAIVGGYTDKGYLGAAWVFTRTAGVWSQQGSKLFGSDAAGNARMGQSVSLSADGNTALIGGNADDTNLGAAWVFTRTAGIWSQQGSKLVGTGALGAAQQGISVSLSADGNKAVIGGKEDDGGNGAIWVFTRSGTAWNQEGGKLTGSGSAGPAGQGAAVMTAGDGNTSIVGGSGDDGGTGAAWVYGLGVQMFTITSVAGPNGTISPSGVSPVDYGDSLAFTITPDPGYFVSDVTVDSVSVGSTASYTFLNVTGNHTIEAYFEQSEYTLTVSTSGQGSVLTVPVQATYLYGVGVTLTATPADSTWLFSHWSGDAGGSSNPLVFPMTANTSITAVFVRIPVLAAMYRSFMPESVAVETGERGRLGRIVKRKPTGVDFQVYILNPYAYVDRLIVYLRSPIDVTRPFGTIPPSTPVPLNTRSNRWAFIFSPPLSFTDTIRVYGFGTKGRYQAISWHRFLLSDIPGSPIGAPGSIAERNALLLPMPNRLNILSEVFAQGGFEADRGLLIGKDRSDSSRSYGWLLAPTYKYVFKTLNYRNIQHTGTPRGLDYYVNGRAITRRQKKILPTKQNNRLLANLVTLKMGIVASAMGKTPVGFGELIYDDESANPLNGMMIRDISARGDSLMMGSYEPGYHNFAPPAVFLNLDSTVRKINEAFEGPMDTISFASELVAEGTRELGEVAYLKPNPTVVPFLITPVGSPFEEVPEEYVLYQNYPNPFNPATTISFEIPEESQVTLSVFNMLGQRVAVLADNEELDVGEYDFEFDAAHLASGVYLYRIDARSIEGSGKTFIRTGKMVLLK